MTPGDPLGPPRDQKSYFSILGSILELIWGPKKDPQIVKIHQKSYEKNTQEFNTDFKHFLSRKVPQNVKKNNKKARRIVTNACQYFEKLKYEKLLKTL